MKKKIIGILIGIFSVFAIAVLCFMVQKQVRYDVTIDSSDLSVTLVLPNISIHEPVDKLQTNRCIWFSIESRNKLYCSIKDNEYFEYSIIDGKRSNEESDFYVLVKDGVYFYLSGEWEETKNYYAVCLSRGVLSSELDVEGAEDGDFPFPLMYHDEYFLGDYLNEQGTGYFCPWSKTIGITDFNELCEFYTGKNGEYVIIDKEQQVIYLRPRTRIRQTSKLVWGGDWLDYIGKMTVSDEGITISFSDEYAKEAAVLMQ